MLERINKDIVEAMKSKDTLKLATLRMLKGAIDLERINKKLDKVLDEDIVAIIGKQIKTRKESILEFEKGNRQDLIEKAGIAEGDSDFIKLYKLSKLNLSPINFKISNK